MASPDDYYEILQVSPNADEEVIQAAYKRLAFKWHPDKRPGDQFASEKMKLLNTAYEVLSDPQKRKNTICRGSPASPKVLLWNPRQHRPSDGKNPEIARTVDPERKNPSTFAAPASYRISQ